MKQYEEQHILEALAFEFGGEWHSLEKFHQSDTKSNAWTDKDDRWWYQSNVLSVKIDITARMERALEVTAPWEWKNWSFKLRAEDGTPIVLADVSPEHTDDKWLWSIAMGDGPNMDLFADSEEDAKRDARAAYLRWMKGGRP